MTLDDAVTTCATCQHWDLIVFPPSTTPAAQCWSPDYETVGRWYTAQGPDGKLVLMGNCRSYDAASMDFERSPQKGP